MNPLHEDLRGLARLLGFRTLNNSPEHKLFQAVERRQPRFGGIDLDPLAMECLAIWWAMQFPAEPLLLVTSTEWKGAEFIKNCRQLLLGCETVSKHCWIGHKNAGLCLPHASEMTVVHMRPHVLDTAEVARKARLILIPDLDDIPGCFIRSMCAIPGSQDRILVVNAAR